VTLDGTVRLAEPTGAQTHVTFARDGSSLIAALPGSARVAVGDQVRVHCAQGALHVFDSATGDRV
jgi:multiple sugar transport system ATP-binding protein